VKDPKSDIQQKFTGTIYKHKDFTGIMMTINSYVSIITLNMNSLNAPIKRHRVVDRIKRQDPSICCLQETHFEPKDTSRLRVKKWRSIFHASRPQKKAGVASQTN